MTAISNQPANKSFLSPLGFKFTIKKTPHINYFVQAASLPSITLNRTDVPTPFIKIPVPGDHLDFGEFTLSYKVDEDLKNYLEIYNWMIALGFPDNFDQYRIPNSVDRMTGQGLISDGTLTILSSAMNPVHQVTFLDMFPTSISELEFTTTDSDINYLTSTVSFAYRKFDIISM